MNEINPAYLAMIPLVWCVVSLALARLGGWSKLAQHYAATGDSAGESPQAPTARMRSGKFGAIQYYSALNFRATEQGLRVSVAFPLRLGHRPLMIPWDQIHHVSDDPLLFSHSIRMSIGKPTIARAVLPGWVKYHMPRRLRPS